MKHQLAFILVCFASNHLYSMETSSSNNSKKKGAAISHASSPMHQCNDCNKQYVYKSILEKHISKKHSITKKAMAQYLMVDSLAKNISPQEQLTCPNCQKTFEQKKRHYLIKHVFRKHKINPFFCMHEECLNSFATSIELHTHKLTHLGPQEALSGASAHTIALSETNEDAVMASNTENNMTIDNLDSFNNSIIDNKKLHISDLDQLNLVSDEQLALGDINQADVDLENLYPNTSQRAMKLIHTQHRAKRFVCINAECSKKFSTQAKLTKHAAAKHIQEDDQTKKAFEEYIAFIMSNDLPYSGLHQSHGTTHALRISNLDQLNLVSDEQLALDNTTQTNIDPKDLYPDKPKNIWMPEKITLNNHGSTQNQDNMYE